MMVPWQKDFEVGHPRIDAEHREVVDLLNELDVCIATKAPDAMVDTAVADLVAALTRHLTHCHEPKTAADMADEADRLRNCWRQGQGGQAHKALKTLAHDWLDHVCERARTAMQ